MLGHAAIAETALADVGGVLQVATAEMSGISSASSIGVGELVGVASMSAVFSQDTEVSTKVSGVIDLSSVFLKSHADDLVEPVKVLSKEALKKLSEYSWPGNVRQLENTCYWLALMAPSKDIQPSDLPQDILDGKVLNPSSDDWRSGRRSGRRSSCRRSGWRCGWRCGGRG